MGLYIGGGLTRHAIINDDDWKLFDDKKELLQQLAEQFQLSISRRLNDKDNLFVIANERLAFEHFYEYGVFEYDLTIKADETFNDRSEQFISALNTSNLPDNFKELIWNKPEKRYYTFS